MAAEPPSVASAPDDDDDDEADDNDATVAVNAAASVAAVVSAPEEDDADADEPARPSKSLSAACPTRQSKTTLPPVPHHPLSGGDSAGAGESDAASSSFCLSAAAG